MNDNLSIANCKECKHAYEKDTPRTSYIDYDKCDTLDILSDTLVIINNVIHCADFISIHTKCNICNNTLTHDSNNTTCLDCM